MTITLKVSENTKQKMIEYFEDKKRNKTPDYAIFQADEADTVVTLYNSGKAVFQGRSADIDAAMWKQREMHLNKGVQIEEKNSEKNFEIFKKVRFINFAVVLIVSTALLITMDSLITLWVGKEYVLSSFVLIVLIINFYQAITRTSYSVFKEAGGVFYEDRYVPLIESILNIVASIILVKIFGLAGVFMGTIISSLALWGYSYPKFVYKKLLKRSYFDYIKETLAYLGLFIITITVAYYLASKIIIEHIFLSFCCKLIVGIMIPLIVLMLVFHNSSDLDYFKKVIKLKK